MVDTHAHLGMEDFETDREEIIKHFEANGIEFVVEVGYDLKSSIRSIDLSKNDRIYAAAGVHPHDVKDLEDGWIEKIEKLCKNSKLIAVGEIGLDYYRDLSPRELQRKYFAFQLELAQKMDLPVILHIRDAYQDAYEIVKNYDVNGVIHSFNGTVDDLKKFLDLGFYIGVGGMATYRKNDELRRTLSLAPVDRIFDRDRLSISCPSAR